MLLELLNLLLKLVATVAGSIALILKLSNSFNESVVSFLHLVLPGGDRANFFYNAARLLLQLVSYYSKSRYWRGEHWPDSSIAKWSERINLSNSISVVRSLVGNLTTERRRVAEPGMWYSDTWIGNWSRHCRANWTRSHKLSPCLGLDWCTCRGSGSLKWSRRRGQRRKCRKLQRCCSG